MKKAMRRVPLSDVMDVERDGVDPSALAAECEYIGLDALDSEGHITRGSTIASAQVKSTKFRFTSGHILFGKLRPYLRKVAAPDFDGVCSTDIIPIYPKRNTDRRYLMHWLRTEEVINRATKESSGANLPRISPSVLTTFEIPLPETLAEQKRLAAILDHADGIRRKRQQALRLADEFLRSVFLDMFGDPVANPKGWPKITLGELFKVKSGNAMIGKNMAIGGRFPVYGGNGISGYHDEFMFAERRIVLGRVGVYCGAVHYTQPNSWITDNALYVEGVRKPFNDQYLLASLRFANLNQYAGQAAQPLISGGRIYPIEILDPPLPVQITFAEIVAQSEKSKARQEAATSEAEDLFQSLQHRAFSGQL